MKTWLTELTDGFLVRARAFGADGDVYSAEIEIFKIDHRDDDVPMFLRRGSLSNGDCTREPDEAEVSAKGFIKWDGCSNWDWPSLDHFCDPDVGAKLHKAFDAAFRLAYQLIPSTSWEAP